MKSTKLFLTLLSIGLLMQVPGLAHAQSAPNADAEGRLRGFEGEVVNSDGVAGDVGVLTIKDPRTGEQRVIRLTFVEGRPDFSIKTPGSSDGVRSNGITSIKPGAAVAVLVRQVGVQWLAVEVLVKPKEPTRAPRTGVVMDSNPEEGTITILTSRGISRTLWLEAGAATPADGEVIIAFAGPGYSVGSPAGPERVTGLTRAAQVRERLERNLEEITSGESDLNGAEPRVKAKHIESLMGLLDQQTSRHIERLERALKHSTSENRRGLVEAIVHTANAHKQGRIKAEGIRATIVRSAVKDTGGIARAAEQAAERAARDVVRDAEDTLRDAEHAAEDADRAAEDAARDADKAADKAAEDADRAAEDAAVRAADKAAEDAVRDAEQAAKDAARAAEQAAKDAARAAEQAAEDAARAAGQAAEDAARAAGQAADKALKREEK